jgi:hypothetical protein
MDNEIISNKDDYSEEESIESIKINQGTNVFAPAGIEIDDGDESSTAGESIISSIPSSKLRKKRGAPISIPGSSSEASFTLSSVSAKETKPKLSHSDILLMKKELLYQFERLEKKGINLPRKFTMNSSLEEMQVEYERLKKDRTVDVSVRFQRKMLMAIITGLEFMNNKFDPFDVQLDGWSESVNDSINDYDEIFEELHEKYKGKANMAPELKLMFALGGSAFMFHLRNTMFKSALPGMADVMKQQQQQRPTSSTKPPSAGGLGGLMSGLMGGGIGNILGGMMGGGGGAPNPFTNPPPSMFNPPNVNDFMHNNDRVEEMSTISESEMSVASSHVTGKSKTNRRTLNL